MLPRIIVFVIFIGLASGMYFFINSTKPLSNTAIPSPASQNLSTTYFGKFPCADCPGLDITITFNETNSSTNSGTYIEKDLYQERNDNQPYTTVGQWMLTIGTPTDPNAQVYVLNPAGQGEPSYYQVIDDNTLQLLDSNKQVVQSPFNSKLTKQP